ncbi:RHS repeat-associated core domain-containing protein [Streptomyces wuyuanensis]|uniref:RHS repeat-associated core domain-containing protein n=1 Tax=Streptomyces wuyuanensis TaxID=1196353 RepID=UPI00382652E7
MGYTIPEGVDTMLDIVGVGWPNVDEDAYRDMADSLREFADDADDDAGTAYGHIQKLLSSGQSESLTALDKHWSKVQGKHKDLAKAARLVAGALDRVADIIVARKIAAVGELADLCATVGITLAFAPVTAGLSTLLAGAKIAATRIAFKRILKEMAEAAVAEIVATLTEPAVAAIENIVADLAIQTAFNVAGVQDGYNTDRTVQAGKDGLQLNSAAGPTGPGPGGGPEIDHDAHGKAGLHLASVQVTMKSRAGSKLGKAKGHHGRAKGKDSLTAVLDTTIEGVTEKLTKALDDLGDHVGKKVPAAITKGSKTHKDTDQGVRDRVKNILTRDGKDEGGLGDRRGTSQEGPNRKGGDTRVKPNSLNGARNDARRHSISLENKTCKNDPVDIATGEMTLAQADLVLPSVLPLALRRTHLSEYRYGYWFGRSWASTLDERIELDARGRMAIWAREDGSVLVYPRLPAPDDAEGVLPLEGPHLPLLHGGQQDSETSYRVVDTSAGIIRTFTGSPYKDSPAFWLSELEDRNGNTVTFVRRGDGAPVRVDHDGGYQVITAVVDGRVADLSLRTFGGPVKVMSYGYDSDGNLDAVFNSSGLPLRFTYDAEGRITSWTDRNDSAFQYVYDSLGRVVRTIGPDGILSSTFTYERHTENGVRTTRYTDSSGATTIFHLNDRFQVIAETDPLGATQTSEYDEFDRLRAVTDPSGATSRLSYDADGRPTELIRADGHRTTVTYDERGLPVSLIEPDGAQWLHTYDERGNRTTLTDPSGAATHYTIGPQGAVTAVTNALGERVEIIRNAAGLPLSIADASGTVRRYEYDPFGRPVLVSGAEGAGVTRLQWSVEGQLVCRTGPDGTSERWEFDGEGNCTLHTDPLGATTRSEYTHFDLLAARLTPDGARHTFTYDTERRLTKVTNPQSLSWTYTYDAAGQLTGETDFNGHTMTYAYDTVGRLIRRINAAGQTVTYRYDPVGQLTDKTVDGREIVFDNDACGRLVRAAGPDATLTYRYDAVGRIVEETVDGRTLSTTCDAVGRRTHRITPLGIATTYSYDATGNYETLTASGRTLSFEHDAAGREMRRSLGDRFTLAFGWDQAGQLTGQTLTAQGSAQPAIHRTYAYREDGHLTAITDRHTGHRDFTVDRAGRVTAVQAENWTERYAYDEAGNQTHASWPDKHPGSQARGVRSYAGSRLVSAGRIRYEHDAQGRVVLRQKSRLSRKPDTWRYTWDAEDHLTSVTTPDGTRWRYLYDPLGRRIAKQRLSANGAVAEETRFTWDGTTLTEQTTHVAGSPETLTLTWDYDGHAPLAQTETKSLADAPQETIDHRFFAIVTDQIGTPTELVDEYGTVAWRIRATLWGATTWNRDAAAYTPLRFPGQYYDPETELHHNYFRHYDPQTARYLSLDPLGLDAAPNPATYVDNPHTLTDPLGLAPCDESDVSWGGRVRYGRPGPGGRATTMRATIESDMTGGKTNPQAKVPGYEKYKKLNKTHLLGAQIGGSNKDPRNFVTMHRFANSPVMRKIEDQIREAVDKRGETIEYTVTPVYRSNDPTDVVPIGLTIEARGNKGFSFTPYEGGSNTNLITILNVPKPT